VNRIRLSRIFGFAGSACLLCVSLPSLAQYRYAFQDPKLPVEQRVTDILAHMTLEEKIICLGTDPTVPRLGIAGTGHVEGLHGLALGGPGGWEGRGKVVLPTTQFPQARGLGQTWDPALIEEAAAVEGYETRYDLGRYSRGGLVVRAPNADLSRDPRWGRSEESYGEDPYLVGTLAVAFIRGLQGRDPRYWQTASLMKHFLANSNEDGRAGSSSNFDDRLFYEYYSVPFRMGMEQSKSNAFMTAYNAWNGIPMAAQPVLKNVVERDWGFDGIICTDAGALTNMVTEHKYYPNMDEAAAGAIHAGVNQFLDKYKDAVQGALSKKLITEHDIDTNLRGVFRVMIHLGMLDPASMVPYTKIGRDDAADLKGDPSEWPEHQALARKVTDESIVLLKNETQTLPLDRTKLSSIAVIGPYADQVLLDWYSGTPPYSISPLSGIQKLAGSGIAVKFAKGDDVAQATALAHASDVVIAVVGNHPTCNAGWAKCPVPSDGKEAVDRKSIDLEQEALVQQLYAANPHTIVVLNASFPFAVNWSQAHIPAILEMTHNSEEEGTGLADVLFGDYNPAGRLTQTWPKSLAQLPPMMDYDIRHGRTYMYAKEQPLYAFGHGLSYTSFAYSNLRLSSETMRPDGSVAVRVDVKNTGSRDGSEVVQLYVQHVHSKLERPIQELKGFERISIPKGQTRTVQMQLPASSLAYWNTAERAFSVEKDSVRIRVGAASDDIRIERTLTLE
jgi:beta-glucosidase